MSLEIKIPDRILDADSNPFQSRKSVFIISTVAVLYGVACIYGEEEGLVKLGWILTTCGGINVFLLLLMYLIRLCNYLYYIFLKLKVKRRGTLFTLERQDEEKWK